MKTGWPPGLLQDDDRGLSKWFASKPDARRLVRERCKEIEREHMTQHTELEPMADRELLELAAKAAGYETKPSAFKPDVMVIRTHEHEWTAWTPLTDDGDALRLAVKLRLDISHTERTVMASEGEDSVFLDGLLFRGSDAFAATRRVIVRVAAEIGKDAP